MRRFLLCLIASTPLLAADPPKKEEPKKPMKTVLSDPKDLKNDADYAIQGEYEGTVSLNSGEKKVGAQVVAKGKGEFAVKVYMGGLPGDGWDEKTIMETAAKRGEKEVAIDGKGFSGTIGSGKLAIKDGMKIDTTLTKTERKSPTLGEKPPKDAVVLFAADGDEKNWTGGKVIEQSDGKVLNNGIKTKKEFGAFKLHVEFRLPWMPESGGQGRGNSGVYLQDRYELQVLDSFGLKGENNECGGFYTLHKPKVNLCLPPMVWQTYDIDFTPAAFAAGKKTKPARATVKHNGVVIQDDVELKNETGGGQKEADTPGVIQFQNHGDPVVFRNVWIVEKK